MHERQRNSLTVRQRNPEEVCVPPWKPGCYISCYATQQPASQSAVPVWGERSTSASSARRTFNWPHVTAAPLSPSCFWAFPDFSCFPIPLCHFPSCQSSDEKSVCSEGVVWCVNPLFGCLLPLSDQFVDVPLPFSLGSSPASYWNPPGE